jgi:hypothetical protein
MSSGTIVAIVVVVILVAAVIAGGSLVMRRRRLQQRFGPEYDRALADSDSRRQAEAELAAREKRVRSLDIRPLDPAARDRYSSQWMAIQEQFVDSPASAVTSAQGLITSVMTERGYPTEDAGQITADLSVEHASTIDQFRTAQELSGRAAGGTASTEDLRQAMVHYRALFRDLLGETADDSVTTTDPAATPPDAAVAEPVATGQAGTIRTDTMPVNEVPADVGPDYAVQDFDYPATEAAETAPAYPEAARADAADQTAADQTAADQTAADQTAEGRPAPAGRLPRRG